VPALSALEELGRSFVPRSGLNLPDVRQILRRFFEQYLQRIETAYSSSLKTIHDWILAWDTIKEA
jgi:hypothetical protein